MKRWLLLWLAALLLAGCSSASASYGVPALDDYEEYYDEYDISEDYVLKEDAFSYVWENDRDLILDYIRDDYEPDDIYGDVMSEVYFEGYDDAKNGNDPAYLRPGEEPGMNEWVKFVANKSKAVYHNPYCPSVESMSEENKMFWSGPEEDLADLGYSAHSCVTEEPEAEEEADTEGNPEILDDYNEEDEYDLSAFDVIETADSTAFKVIGYDADGARLFVEFRTSGAWYIYSDVSPDVWQALKGADSKGTYFNKYIRGNGYKYERIK